MWWNIQRSVAVIAVVLWISGISVLEVNCSEEGTTPLTINATNVTEGLETSASSPVTKIILPLNPITQTQTSENDENYLRRSQATIVIPTSTSHSNSISNSQKWNSNGETGGGGFKQICIKASGETKGRKSNPNEDHPSVDDLHIIIDNNIKKYTKSHEDGRQNQQNQHHDDHEESSCGCDSSNEKRESSKNKELWDILRSIMKRRKTLEHSQIYSNNKDKRYNRHGKRKENSKDNDWRRNLLNEDLHHKGYKTDDLNSVDEDYRSVSQEESSKECGCDDGNKNSGALNLNRKLARYIDEEVKRLQKLEYECREDKYGGKTYKHSHQNQDPYFDDHKDQLSKPFSSRPNEKHKNSGTGCIPCISCAPPPAYEYSPYPSSEYSDIKYGPTESRRQSNLEKGDEEQDDNDEWGNIRESEKSNRKSKLRKSSKGRSDSKSRKSRRGGGKSSQKRRDKKHSEENVLENRVPDENDYKDEEKIENLKKGETSINGRVNREKDGTKRKSEIKWESNENTDVKQDNKVNENEQDEQIGQEKGGRKEIKRREGLRHGGTRNNKNKTELNRKSYYDDGTDKGKSEENEDGEKTDSGRKNDNQSEEKEDDVRGANANKEDKVKENFNEYEDSEEKRRDVKSVKKRKGNRKNVFENEGNSGRDGGEERQGRSKNKEELSRRGGLRQSQSDEQGEQSEGRRKGEEGDDKISENKSSVPGVNEERYRKRGSRRRYDGNNDRNVGKKGIRGHVRQKNEDDTEDRDEFEDKSRKNRQKGNRGEDEKRNKVRKSWKNDSKSDEHKDKRTDRGYSEEKDLEVRGGLSEERENEEKRDRNKGNAEQSSEEKDGRSDEGYSYGRASRARDRKIPENKGRGSRGGPPSVRRGNGKERDEQSEEKQSDEEKDKRARNGQKSENRGYGGQISEEIVGSTDGGHRGGYDKQGSEGRDGRGLEKRGRKTLSYEIKIKKRGSGEKSERRQRGRQDKKREGEKRGSDRSEENSSDEGGKNESEESIYIPHSCYCKYDNGNRSRKRRSVYYSFDGSNSWTQKEIPSQQSTYQYSAPIISSSGNIVTANANNPQIGLTELKSIMPKEISPQQNAYQYSAPIVTSSGDIATANANNPQIDLTQLKDIMAHDDEELCGQIYNAIRYRNPKPHIENAETTDDISSSYDESSAEIIQYPPKRRKKTRKPSNKNHKAPVYTSASSEEKSDETPQESKYEPNVNEMAKKTKSNEQNINKKPILGSDEERKDLISKEKFKYIKRGGIRLPLKLVCDDKGNYYLELDVKYFCRSCNKRREKLKTSEAEQQKS